ncbi:IS200/IS605 family transposase [Bacteroides sp. OttesenSCG-928-J23]|nr:IS200/IS605 family transposase [Bacteroides sp. OttesenSCG-928-J23]MDL2299973.1 IS200/IS605 family transposase [Bacteroides sp. OttesenSCG-928-E20]
MSYIKVMIHCVWSTKNRAPLLADREMRHVLFNHILTNARSKGVYIDHVGGEKEHIHCLLSLGSEQSIAKVVQLIKGESSYWLRKEYGKAFSWQDDYFAVSVGESQLPVVRNYIANQEEHHKRKTYTEEYNEFMERYEFNE